MKTTRILIPAVLIVCCAIEAQARPGFYTAFGLGPSTISGRSYSPGDLGIPSSGDDPNYDILTTDLSGGAAGLLRIGYNIKGYVAPELQIGGQAKGTVDTDEWSAQAHVGVRLYPMWHWQDRVPEQLRPFEPSLTIAYGATWLGYRAQALSNPDERAPDHVGFSSDGSWRFGLGSEYFVSDSFKVGFDYNYVTANFGTFIFNSSDNITFTADPPAEIGIHQFLLTVAVHVTPAE